MPTTPATPWNASVIAPTAKTTSVPSPHRAMTLPGSAPRTGPAMTVPSSPAAIAYSSSAPSRMTARAEFAGRA